jgi:flavin reductase (DIM6/NTAB) family NADH-FMN oxidoreductase RutF/DNA-binding MarR family transcriptional regulator
MNSDNLNAPFDTRAFRTALGSFATGVTIVTTRGAAAGDIGITANSFNSVSLDPPMILWSLSRRALSLDAFLQCTHFAVHVLAADQDQLSQRFATAGADKFADLQIERGAGEAPLLAGCSARFQCRTAFKYEGGDHIIFVGEVLTFDAYQKPPLLFHAGRYALAVERAGELTLADSWSSEPDSSFSRDFLIYLLGRAHFQMYRGLSEQLERHALTEQEWFILSLLGVTDNRSIAELDRLLWLTGIRVTYERVAGLAAAGLVQLHGGHDPAARVTLSEKGRAIVVQLVAAAKAVEEHAERNLGPGETRFLKNMLHRLIRDTDPGQAPLTRTEEE